MVILPADISRFVINVLRSIKATYTTSPPMQVGYDLSVKHGSLHVCTLIFFSSFDAM